MQIIPTILEKSFTEAEEKIRLVSKKVKWIQIDVIDNIFSPGKTFELELLTRTNFEIDKLLLDIHLMVKEPIKWLEKCFFVNAVRVIGQVEMMSDRENFIKKVKDMGMEAGLAFDVDTEIGEIPDETDMVLLMGRKAGFESGYFNEEILKKIDLLNKIKQKKDLKFSLGVDGGITLGIINELKNQGVDAAYCGGSIFNGNVNDNLNNLYDAINR